MQMPFEVLSYRHLNGKKNPSNRFTIVCGLVTLLDGQRAYAEAFLRGESHFQPGSYALEVEIRVNQDRRITADVRGVLPLRQQQQPAPVKAAA